MEVTTVALDLRKDVFRVHGNSTDGKVVFLPDDAPFLEGSLTYVNLLIDTLELARLNVVGDWVVVPAEIVNLLTHQSDVPGFLYD